MTTIQPATPQLLALAAEMRPDWESHDLQAALAAARTAGWDWPKTFVTVSRLLADSQANPRDLVEAVQSPIAPRSQQPGDWASGAAHARELLATRASGGVA